MNVVVFRFLNTYLTHLCSSLSLACLCVKIVFVEVILILLYYSNLQFLKCLVLPLTCHHSIPPGGIE